MSISTYGHAPVTSLVRCRNQRIRSERLAPSLFEIYLVTCLLLFYLSVDMLFGEGSHRNINYGGPLVLSAILGTSNWRMIRNDGKQLWTALFWFRLSTAVYFGLGTTFVYIFNEYTLYYVKAFYPFQDDEVFKLNLIVTFSVIIVLLSARVVLIATRRKTMGFNTGVLPVIETHSRGLLAAAVVFLALGLIVNYIFVVPYRMGWTDTVLPGIVQSFTRMIPIGVFLITLWGLHKARWALPGIFILVAIEMLFSLLIFAKSDFLFLLIMMCLAVIWGRVTVKKVIIISLVVVGAYLAIKPVVDNARTQIQSRYGENRHAGIAERVEILSSYFTEGPVRRLAESELQGSLSRLSYVNAATFVIHLHDIGQPSDWPRLIPAVFVPRVLWPEKPVITAIGIEIYELSTGRDTSSAGAGIFADAYWAWGWWGVFVFMSAYGLIIGGLTRFASNVMQDGRWIYFPVVLLALRIGFRTDGHYISDVPGALVLLTALYVAVFSFDKFVLSPLKKR